MTMQLEALLKCLPKRHFVAVRYDGQTTSHFAKTLLRELPLDTLRATVVYCATYSSGTEVCVRKEEVTDPSAHTFTL